MKQLSSVSLSLERSITRIRKILSDKLKWSRQVYVYQRVPEYREMWRAVAQEIGATFTMLSDELWELELDGVRTRILNYKLEFDNPVTLEMAGMKPLVYRMMKANGLPVAEHFTFVLGEMHLAEHFMGTHPGGCVVKPAYGTSSGLGVTTHIFTSKQLRKAVILASLYCRQLIIERMIPGESYRVLVLDGRVVDAVCRRGPRILGDGCSTVRQLLKAENERRVASLQAAVDIDDDCLYTLRYQALSLESIAEKNRVVLLKSVNHPTRKREEVRTIYNECVSDLLCLELKRDAEVAANILRSDFLGIDFITTDPTVPLEKSGGAIIEVNTTPGLHHHYFPEREKIPRVAVAAVESLLRRKAVSGVPR